MLDTVDFPIGHIIIIDNGENLESVTCDWAAKISIINMPSNLGVPTSWNLGVQLSPWAQYWLFSQDDILWTRGGLQMIHERSGSDVVTMDMVGARPFSSFSVGENVFRRVGMFDESYFPLLGDDFNFHKRCHLHEIKEVDISGSFIAEKSATIRSMLENGHTNRDVLADNYIRSVFGPPVNTGWQIARRRNQGLGLAPKHPDFEDIVIDLDSDYIVHNQVENEAFEQNMDVHRQHLRVALELYEQEMLTVGEKAGLNFIRAAASAQKKKKGKKK
jgi:hypothetical protein